MKHICLKGYDGWVQCVACENWHSEHPAVDASSDPVAVCALSVPEAVQQASGPLLVEIVKSPSSSLGISLATTIYRSKQVIIIDKIKAASVVERWNYPFALTCSTHTFPSSRNFPERSARVSLSQVWSAACGWHPSVHRRDQHGALLADGGHAATGEHVWCCETGDPPSQSEQTSCQAARHRYVTEKAQEIPVRQRKKDTRVLWESAEKEEIIWVTAGDHSGL